MLTSNIKLFYYNQLLANLIVYVAINEPVNEIARLLGTNLHNEAKPAGRLVTMALAEAPPSSAENLYDLLGVKRDATKHEIHRAFRKLAKKYHPDKNKDKGAQDEFIKIFKAYETLNDEKKRKEYDDQLDGNHANSEGQHFTNSWHSNGMNDDFDINEFFKQYEDQFVRHSQHYGRHHQQHYQQHYNQHNSQHQRFTFHGVNLDDLFHDIDEDEFGSFERMFDLAAGSGFGHHHHQADMDGTFGDGASYFGSHFPSQIHNTLHNHQQTYHSANRAAYSSCQTTTRHVNGMVMTQTSCS